MDSNEAIKLKGELYEVYCKARMYGLNDTDIKKGIEACIEKQCSEVDVGRLNDYCQLPIENIDCKKIALKLVVEFEKLYTDNIDTLNSLQDRNVEISQENVKDKRNKLIKSVIAIVLFGAFLYFDWLGLRSSIFKSEDASMAMKMLVIVSILGYAKFFVMSIKWFIVGMIVYTLLAIYVVKDEYLYLYITIAGGFIGILTIFYDIYKMIKSKQEEKQVKVVATKNKEFLANEITKKRKSMQELIMNGEIDIHNIEKMGE